MGTARLRLGGESIENLLDAAPRKAPVYHRPQCRERRRAGILSKASERRIDPIAISSSLRGEYAERPDQLGNPVLGHEVSGKPAIKCVGRSEAGAGQAEITAQIPGTAIEKPRRPNVGKETDRGLWHCEERPLGSDAIGAVDRNSSTTAHSDPVDDRDVGLGKTVDAADQFVFFAKEDGRQVGIATDSLSGLVDCAHVTSGAEGALAGAAHDHGTDRWVTGPGAQCRSKATVVVEGQRVERLRPVDR